MKNKCDCYHILRDVRCIYNTVSGQPIRYDDEYGVCWGTKEKDRCACGGDETKCDFYQDVRKKAQNVIDNNKTNGDLIRSMSDSALAEHLVNIGWDCHLCSEHERLSDAPLLRGESCDEQCVKHCYNWLIKKVKM